MIAEARDKLAAELADGVGVPVHVAWPDRFNPPCVLLVPPTGTYLAAEGYSTYTLYLDVVAVAERGSYDVILPSLERLIEQVLTFTADWSLSGVDRPSLVTVAGQDFLATAIHISKHVQP